MKSRKYTNRVGIGIVCSALLAGCGGNGDGGGNENEEAGVTLQTPSRSTSIALTSDDTKLVVVNRQNNSVSIIQVQDEFGHDTEELLAELPVGKEPRFVAISPDNNRAFITNAVDGTVSIIDLASPTPELLTTSITVGTEPRGIAFTPNGRYAYVANHTEGTVSVIRSASLEVVNTVTVGGNPMAIAISNDGDADDNDESVYVTRFYSEVIDPINRPDGFNDSKEGKVDYFTVAESLSQHPTAGVYKVAPIADSGFTTDRRHFCQNTRDALEAAGEVVFFNSGADGTGGGAANLAKETFCPDPTSTDIDADGPIANNLQGVYPNYLYGALIRDGVLFIPNVGASPEPPVKFSVNVQALISSINLDSGTDSTINLNNQIKTETNPDSPTESLDRLFGNDIVAIDANVDGDKFLVLSRGGNYVIRASLGDNGQLDIGAPNNVVRFQTGNIPSGIVISQNGKRAYTNNEVSTSVTVIDLDNNQVIERDLSSSEPPVPGTQKHRNVVGKLAFFTALGIPDDLDTNGDDEFDIAIRDIEPLTFRSKASDNAWSGCSSCHEDGHSDNVTWIFPTGPRQTLPLEGTFANSDSTDQRVLNWNAVRGSVTDFNNNSRGVQGGTGFATNVDGINRTAEVFNHGPTKGISDALDAMTEWVANAVRAPIMPDNEDTFAIDSGRNLFTTNCASCHGGEKWTKSSIALYDNNPTFELNPLGANFFADGKVPPVDPDLTVAGPQIVSVDTGGVVTKFLDDVGTLNLGNELEIRGAGAIGGGEITIAGDPNEGLEVTPQSTQGFAALGGAGFNTPSLLGVAYHSPYFHDGSAVTLDEVFERHTLPGAADAAINEIIVSEEEQEHLKAFLLSIDDDTPVVPLP